MSTLTKLSSQELKTKEMKTKIMMLSNDTIMRTMTDYMAQEDLSDILTLTQEMEIPLEHVLEVYLSSHPYILTRIMEELNELAKTISNFAKSE